MFEDEERKKVESAIAKRISSDRIILDDLIKDIKDYGLKTSARSIQHYTSSSLAIVSSDGGNHSFKFDPFHHQLIRVVDSSGQTLGLKAIALTTDPKELSNSEFKDDITGQPTAVGRLMNDLGNAAGRKIKHLHEICASIPEELPEQLDESAGWVLSYRDLWEWAVLYERIMYTTFAQSTLLIRDGLLRTKLFNSPYFRIMGELLSERIEQIKQKERKDIFLVGLSKTSSVVDRYRLAFALEDVFPPGKPYYVRVPREIEAKVYKFPEYSYGRERLPKPTMQRRSDGVLALSFPSGLGPREDSKYVFGSMFMARLSEANNMPIWAVDIFDDQIGQADRIIGHLFADSIDGFPIPAYPNAIQRAHDAAKLTDLDAYILNEAIMKGIRNIVGDDNEIILDRIKLAGDVTGRRY